MLRLRDVSSTRKHRDKPNFLSFSLPAPEHHQTAATMTEAEALEKKQHKSSNQNGDVLPEATREDVFDHTYKEKEGPKPGTIIVWKNVILMTALHIGALYAISLIPSASPLTLLWCKYKKILPVTAFFFIFFFQIYFSVSGNTYIFSLSHICYVSSPAHSLTTGACINLCMILPVAWVLWD